MSGGEIMPKIKSSGKKAAGKKGNSKKIAVMTSGGDAPGMNCAIRAVTRTAIAMGAQVYFVYHGYQGVINGDIHEATLASVGGIINQGGTILGTARCEEFKTKAGRKKGADSLNKKGIDGLVVIGGDGSFHGAEALYREFGFQTIGVPATIDNDIAGTDYAIGFDTALNTALDAIDKIRDTATSHERLFVIEVMGREAGFIALQTGIGGGAEAVLIPEVPYDLQKVCQKIEVGIERGKKSSIIVVAEGAGSSIEIGYRIQKMLNIDTRISVIGHIQRGGSPTALDRMVASKLGKGAVEQILAGQSGMMVGLVSNKVETQPLQYAWEIKKNIDEENLKLAEILAL
jgi:6-phosphofructokinase 1